MPSPHEVILAPSILGGDHANLRSSLNTIENAGLKWVHFDIMDGHFVPNLSFGPQVVKLLRSKSKLFFDVHLMLSNPHDYVDAFIDAGADQITIHVESESPIAQTLAHIKSRDCLCGLVLNPDTPTEKAHEYLSVCDLALLMTVQPGFGGQSFRHNVLPKINQLDAWRENRGLEYRIEVDGGVDLENAKLCTERGADVLVTGSGFFKAENSKEFIKEILTLH